MKSLEELKNEAFPGYQTTVTIGPEHLQNNGKISIGSILRILQDIAGDHVKVIEKGQSVNEKYGLFWAVTKASLNIERLPELGEELFIRTWPCPQRHQICPRRFCVFDKDGNIIITSCGNWVLVSLSGRAMESHEEIMKNYPGIEVEDSCPAPERKIAFPKAEYQSVFHRVLPHEIDMNGHANNSYYPEWAEALVPEDYAETHYPSHLWIEYLKELKLGIETELQYIMEENSIYVKGYCSGDHSFSLKIDFREK